MMIFYWRDNVIKRGLCSSYKFVFNNFIMRQRIFNLSQDRGVDDERMFDRLLINIDYNCCEIIPDLFICRLFYVHTL